MMNLGRDRRWARDPGSGRVPIEPGLVQPGSAHGTKLTSSTG